MGLTSASMGKHAVDAQLNITKNENEKIIALAGNPNVGKSTLFNNLTGMKQHTGNWPGKTVANAVGKYCSQKNEYLFVDIPGTYSLYAHSREEEIARNFICFGMPDAVVVVCDATCLERNLNLVLQIMEACSEVIVCVNLLDEAKRKQISVDIPKLSELLGIPVVGMVARKKSAVSDIISQLDDMPSSAPLKITYSPQIENAVESLEPILYEKFGDKINARWLALRLIDSDALFISEIDKFLSSDLLRDPDVQRIIKSLENVGDDVIESVVKTAEQISKKVVTAKNDKYNSFDMKVDRILTSKIFGYPFMLLLLLVVFWITIVGANYPSELLSNVLSQFCAFISDCLIKINTPIWLHDALVHGILRVLCWVVSVMLPPMAIFFPFFTLLEDLGYLPRVAYNLDKPFKCCNACGKQALTMCMGFGCNAAGVTGCRIIDSPRERLTAILTNSFVPCNGRFPFLITLITIFIMSGEGFVNSIGAAAILTLVIGAGIAMTFAASYFLSKTFLKGEPSSFTLELPPYRKPQIGKTIIRSLFDRTLFVVGRAVSIAAPAGLVIWLLANVYVNDCSLLSYCTDFLEPFATLIGLDGVILMAFILGFPANEIVLPIIIMTYLSQGTLSDIQDLSVIKQILVDNGWTLSTAVCTITFSLFHFPCSTTVLTVYKETGSIKWTALSVILPTAAGIALCFLINLII